MGLSIQQIAEQLKIDSSKLIQLLSKRKNKNYTDQSILTEEELQIIYEWTKSKTTQSSKESDKLISKSKNYMQYVISKADVILIDTSSLLQDSGVEFLNHLKQHLIQSNKKLILPYKVYEELQKHLKNKNDKKLAQKSKAILLQLKKYQDEKLLEIYGDETLDNFADNVFQMQITRLRVHKVILLITNDIKLGQDILLLNESQSVNGKPIFVQKVSKLGYLQKIVAENNTKNQSKLNKNKIPENEKFKLVKNIAPLDYKVIGYSSAIIENSVVYDEAKTPIKLVKEVGKGGEGSVYIIPDSNYVAKIYKPEKVTYEKIAKLKLMISKNIEYDGICYPKKLLYNHRNEFVGYLMPKADGRELRYFLFIPKKVFEMRNPTWKRIDLVKLCLTILDKIAYLHERNVILGDINPFNILVVSAEEVYFVDVDSYQIEGFPCPVGTVNYTAPEIQGKNYKDFLRTFGNEYFAVSTLMFNILFLGKSPYSQTGGESDSSNIRAMDFPYTFKREERADNTPKGQWRFIWSNLPYQVKKAFYETFQKGEKHATEHTRLSVQEWQKILQKYYRELHSGKLIEQDEIANEIFPNRFKVIGDDREKLVSCRICNQSFHKWSLNKGLCRSCLMKGEDYNCARCNKELIFTNFEKYVKNLSTPYKYCKDCHSFMNSTYRRINCTTCSSVFTMTYKDKEFYDSKGYDYPKRCLSCRKNNNQGPVRHTTTHRSVYTTHSHHAPPKPKPEKKSSKWCFLTTAACEYYDLPDNCYELETLRKYRDEWLAHQTNGQELINHYYKIAPQIVKEMKNSSQYEQICRWIMGEIIAPCVQMIEENKWQDCLNLYKEMVEKLIIKFIGDDALWKKTN